MLFVSTRQGEPVPLRKSQTWPQLLFVLNYLYFVIQNITIRFANVSKPHTVFGALIVRLYRLLSQSPPFSGNNNTDINFLHPEIVCIWHAVFLRRRTVKLNPICCMFIIHILKYYIKIRYEPERWFCFVVIFFIVTFDKDVLSLWLRASSIYFIK
jgi:hypothetical protein